MQGYQSLLEFGMDVQLGGLLMPEMLVVLLQVVFLHPKDNDGVLMELEEVGHK